MACALRTGNSWTWVMLQFLFNHPFIHPLLVSERQMMTRKGLCNCTLKKKMNCHLCDVRSSDGVQPITEAGSGHELNAFQLAPHLREWWDSFRIPSAMQQPQRGCRARTMAHPACRLHWWGGFRKEGAFPRGIHWPGDSAWMDGGKEMQKLFGVDVDAWSSFPLQQWKCTTAWPGWQC